MIGFVYKDLLVLRRQLRLYLLCVLIYVAPVVAGIFPLSILSTLLVVFGMMLPMSSVAYDDLARWDKYAAATPAGRRGIVAGKYLFSLLCLLAGTALVLGLMLLLPLFGVAGNPPLPTLFINLACLAVSLLLNAMLLPLLLRFGAEKSRIVSLVTMGLVFGAVALVAPLLTRSDGLQSLVPPWLLSALPVTLGLLVVGGFVVSYFISQAIFAKKEL